MLRVYCDENVSEIKYDFFKFSGGEVHFKFLDIVRESVTIETDLINSDELMLLCLMADYLTCSKHLNLLYTPYARQDRKTTLTEPFSFKTFARIINSCNFDCVTVNDPHSDVTPALIDNCYVRKRADVVTIPDVSEPIIVSPDAGAVKANNEVCKLFNLKHVIATKVRDVRTGEITETQVHTDLDLKGKNLLILDDICDGGRTFIELAKVLKTHNPASINLFVTVGIYSKGIEVLNPYFDLINQFYKRGK